jgi:predicted HD phosphohydrolase
MAPDASSEIQLVAVTVADASGTPASTRRSYADQGGRLGPDEQLGLETRPWFVDAVRLRRWDDAAKVAGAVCPPLIEYAPLLERRFGPQAWMGGTGIDRGA